MSLKQFRSLKNGIVNNTQKSTFIESPKNDNDKINLLKNLKCGSFTEFKQKRKF